MENFFAESGERGERRPSSDDVFVTLSSVLQEFRVVDGAFTPSSKRDSFSVQECLSFEDPRVLFISKHDKFKAVLEPFNRLLFTRAFEEVLSREATSDQRIWFFIDELATAGKLPELRALMDEGRSHGARVVLSFQDINGLYETYKREASEDILGQCGNRSFLRLEGGSARRWVEEQLGDSDVWEAKFSRKGSKEDWEFQQRTKKNFNGSQMQSWPKATLEDGFRGIFLVQGQPPWPKHVSPRFIDKHFCGDKKGKVFVRRAVKRSVWTEGDWERLGLDPPAGASSNDGASDPFPPDDEQPKGRASRRHNVL